MMSRRYLLLFLTTTLLLGSLGCGGFRTDKRDTNDEANYGECRDDDDCSGNQPYCNLNECQPCMKDSHCSGELICITEVVNDGPDSKMAHFCGECDHHTDCGSGELCIRPTCSDKTADCTGQSFCRE